jgi:hypothetical protein
MKENVAVPVYKTENNGRGVPPHWIRNAPLSSNVGTNIRRPLSIAKSL